MREVTVFIPEDKLGHFYKMIASYFEDEQPQATPEPEPTVIASEAPPATPTEAPPEAPVSAPIEATPTPPAETAAPAEETAAPARKPKATRSSARGRRAQSKPSRAKAKEETKAKPAAVEAAPEAKPAPTPKKAAAPTRVSTKYAPLVEHLNKRGEDSRTYTFTQFEKVLGFPLPASARTHRAWWANSVNHAQARAWMEAGWRAENLELDKQRITFTRTDAQPAPTETTTAAEKPATKPKSTRTRKPATKRATTGNKRRTRKEQPAPAPGDKYAPLAQALSRADQPQIEFTFQELEEEHGIELPFDARSEATWWANSEAQEQSRAWLEQGYRAEDVDLDEGRVRFKRA